jgi:hypothetical protein
MQESDRVTDLERLLQQIVRNLGMTEPGRIHQPFTVSELMTSIVPYRTTRRALQIETSEDYELALMRLCAGEGGFAQIESEEIGKLFEEEVRSNNPDLSLLRQHDKAALKLNPRRVDQVSARDPHRDFAPRPPVETPPVGVPQRTPSKRPKAVQDATESPPRRCSRCRSDLPSGRVANFCPHCGFDLRRGYCPQCNAELEPEWRHCVSCGHTLPRD